MSDKKRIKIKKSKKITAISSGIRNRYHRKAKLSEYKFLQVLRGFCEDIPAAELMVKTRISEKTIRKTYKSLRIELIQAVLDDIHGFGGTGFFMFRDNELQERGRHFLEVMTTNQIFKEHLRQHGPRTKKPSDVSELLFEVTVKMFCNISMKKNVATLYPPKTREAIISIRDIANWIRENRDTEGFFERYSTFLERFNVVLANMPKLLVQEELQALRFKSVAHRFPSSVLYDDFRRFLSKNPL